MEAARVILRSRRARPSFSRHPWIFEGTVEGVEGSPAPGDAVEVFSHEREFIAHGLFNPKSAIRVRLYSWHRDVPMDQKLIADRLQQAIHLRHDQLGLGGARHACRLVYSESDGLSGLIVDRFADAIVVQMNSLGLARFESEIVRIIEESQAPRAIYRRVDPVIAQREGLTWSDELLRGEAVREVIIEDREGVQFVMDPSGGQKTGAYLDQRENRHAVARFSANRSVLDVFCYTGGFGLVALAKGGAASALGVDSSQEALALAKKNAEHLGVAMELKQGDAAAAMTELARAGRQFGVVICDPPKFAQRSADLEGALRGYEYINRLAMRLVEPHGILATCSCSGLVTREMFLTVLTEACRKEGRDVKLLEFRGQAADHPISLLCPETEYLKCVIAQVA